VSTVKREHVFYDELNPQLRASLVQETDGEWVSIFDDPEEPFDVGDFARVLLAADEEGNRLNAAREVTPEKPKVRVFRLKKHADTSRWKLEEGVVSVRDRPFEDWRVMEGYGPSSVDGWLSGGSVVEITDDGEVAK
jgi:hypothetical protein